jgi:uncharacterized membrane protein YeaQ/YmgE (transglycosylase-associated protein family)
MGIFSWVFFGLIAGALAKLALPGKDPGGWFLTSIIGIAGGLLGGFAGKAMGFGEITGFNLKSFLMAVAGSLILLICYRMLN